MFKDLMGGSREEEEEFVKRFEKSFKPQAGLKSDYKIFIGDKKEPLTLAISAGALICKFGGEVQADVEIHTERETINDIMYGRMTFQRAFMSGEMKMKGDFRMFRALDQVFLFEDK